MNEKGGIVSSTKKIKDGQVVEGSQVMGADDGTTMNEQQRKDKDNKRAVFSDEEIQLG